MGGRGVQGGWCQPLLVAVLAVFVAGSGAAATERYRYTSQPRGRDRVAEVGEVEVRDDPEGFWYCAVTRLADGRERRVELATGPEGALLWAREARSGDPGRQVEVVREGERLLYRRRGGEGDADEALGIPAGQTPCAGPSLLALTRRLPPAGAPREVFFVDFDGRRISGTLAVAGEERVTVPAGTFECYRLELTLRVFLFRPRVQLWVGRDPPHLLVRQEGKRSALGPVFVTELQAVR